MANKSYTARVKRLEDLLHVRETKVIFYTLAKKDDDDILAFIGDIKSYYKRENENYHSFKQRIVEDAEGITLLRASYE